MDKLRRYLVSNLSLLFFSIFLPLFAIASVIFMIKLATYTAIIKLTIAEMGKLYLFVLPELFFYTLPIAFIVSAALALYRLSNDNEMIVAFSLGIPPSFIVKTLAKPAFLLSFLLFTDYLVVMPYIKIISSNFVEQKKAEAKFNLSASEFGHNFGDWMLFINNSDNDKRTYQNIVLFNKTMKDEILIVADNADLINHNGVLQFKLSDGESYSYNKDLFRKIFFNTLYINDTVVAEIDTYTNPITYWTTLYTLYDTPQFGKVRLVHEKKVQQLTSYTLMSLFPLLSVFLIVALGIVHARHQKRWIYLWLFVSIVTFYVATIILQKVLGYNAIWVVSLSWLLVTYGFYRKLVGKHF